ncbi:galactosylgalactosylxylosylprotein 3-beta-glucuronosyltransferase P-like [Adelges cooleyi]|uniref:galactosylgalactosylxylosylprotein 3-beta-glucuronosyltransferase P-like n=1 Tax=Adelges cooleyi TaxID=133065 RepID=UPI00217FA72B|nr:galactosylgalactosylxylosylprotein 3-beta-glucuronosyltransferase P-like [Adelges cooleyi]XP_050425602.1 galactosylgalactosylxylosylprotein 3-beta-glucuronosyltransferase P-like [Adelges cooleyi]XP_050425603.1 galactosylgalactosylxylosylprotein 3-beta-glucuronosyltransferase P-like [Adelges cooleyi]XP_050425604.1 galactosylgalactosylxylosylprotein 3-beta-glucuronosyltransferase P-like [Adelges cooleyi]
MIALPISIQMRILWTLAMGTVFVLLVQYQSSNVWPQQQSQLSNRLDPVAEDLVSLALSKVVIDDDMTLSKEVLLGITRQIARYVVYSSGCNVSPVNGSPSPSTIYIITPTYRRPEQIADLTRMAQTLMLVRDIHWLVVEDSEAKSQLLSSLLHSFGIRFTHLTAPMPKRYKTTKGAKPKGVANRNRALSWIRENANDGIMYFADDDNTYDVRLFNEMRYTQKVSMWPVGLCTKTGLSTPIVENGNLVGFYDGWIAGRKFPVDMAGFAVSVKFLQERPHARMPYKPGFEEDGFLRSLSPFEPREIELKADNCTKILVWHTQTKKNEPSSRVDVVKYKNTNIIDLKRIIV